MAREWLLRGVDPEELKKETEQIPETPRSKWENFWYHHKWTFWGCFFAGLVLVVMLVQMLTRDNPDYRFLMMSETVYASEQLDFLENLLAQYGEDLDGDGKVEVNIQSCLYGDDAVLKHNSGPQIVSAHLAAGDVLFFIWDEDAYRYFKKSTENVSDAGEDFFSDMPVEVTGVLENGKAYSWESDPRREGALKDLFPEKLYFAVRAPLGSAADSTVIHDQSMALLEKFLEGAKGAEENANGADTAVSTTMTTATEETTTTTQGSSASSTTETEPATAQKTTKATEKATSTTKKATTTKRTSPPTEAGHKHKYNSHVQPASCHQGGYTAHKCACGDFYVDNQTAKVDHKYEWKLVKASTETETGMKKYVCIYCGTGSREEVISKKQNQPKIDSRVKIGVSKYTKKPEYSFGGSSVLDKRTWGERPEIAVSKDGSLLVTYYNQQNEKVTFSVEQPSDDTYVCSAVIDEDGTYTVERVTAFS